VQDSDGTNPLFFMGASNSLEVTYDGFRKTVPCYDGAMTLTFRARFDGTVLVPEDPVDLPVGEVRQLEVAEPTAAASASDTSEAPDDRPLLRLLQVLEKLPANLGAPIDAAANVDHYLYGAAKQQ
jgi:hypothetical protein